MRVPDLITLALLKRSFGRPAPLMHRHGVSVLPRLPRVMALAFQPGLLIHRDDLPRFAQQGELARSGLPESP